jgi:hypothetical protein
MCDVDREAFDKWYEKEYGRRPDVDEYETSLTLNGWQARGAQVPGWIDVKERLPDSTSVQWSYDVIALADNGYVFKLACMGTYWQRTHDFVDVGATEVTHWMPLIYPKGS